MTRDDILKILNENIGYERNSSGTNLFGVNDAADCIIEKLDEYPFEKVRKFLDEIYYLSINYRAHDLEKKIWRETQTIIKEINAAELPD